MTHENGRKKKETRMEKIFLFIEVKKNKMTVERTFKSQIMASLRNFYCIKYKVNASMHFLVEKCTIPEREFYFFQLIHEE